ncbi:tryptophan synthase alpha chain [Striga asiatica]|uniref:Tryptophan synthase alpha chain n=1 Tax=Striga asiatica TaxID=4170 RepID=A0A5A7PYR8_STRAF|nr:tryptophan synthase alpha chain [Striga asiatica]
MDFQHQQLAAFRGEDSLDGQRWDGLLLLKVRLLRTKTDERLLKWVAGEGFSLVFLVAQMSSGWRTRLIVWEFAGIYRSISLPAVTHADGDRGAPIGWVQANERWIKWRLEVWCLGDGALHDSGKNLVDSMKKGRDFILGANQSEVAGKKLKGRHLLIVDFRRRALNPQIALISFHPSEFYIQLVYFVGFCGLKDFNLDKGTNDVEELPDVEVELLEKGDNDDFEIEFEGRNDAGNA